MVEKRTEHSTVYSSQFKFDPSLVERAKSFKKENPVYEAPENKIESETVTKVRLSFKKIKMNYSIYIFIHFKSAIFVQLIRKVFQF